MKTTAEIRQAFIDFFARHDHRIVPSSPLVPANDPTLLFTNAGMVQFKDVFLGSETRSYARAVSAQRCVRAGGKHNDLENVGYTARHHTFFEMLGNFSFGDYFKRQAIEYAWRFLTEVCKIAPGKLWVTVYAEDEEAARIWLDHIGVDPERFSRIGDRPGTRHDSDNFWAMGETGPCGPCTEIFFDHGPSVPGGPPGSPDEDGDRFIEIWNLVFMQYDRAADGSMSALPAPSVDTGMGLERLAAVLQGVHSNYQIDLFAKLIDEAARLTGSADRDAASLKVIADHIRACAFLVIDGVLPSNEGRGYVLRRIIRRAVRHGYKLGCQEPFFGRMVAPLAEVMGDAYPELTDQQTFVSDVLEREERRFGETLEQGMKLLEEAVTGLEGRQIPGALAFKLYDTYGFPLDLTRDIARERDLNVDEQGFEQAMDQQRERARAAGRFASADGLPADLIAALPATEFLGHAADSLDEGRLLAIVVDGQPIDRLEVGVEAALILDRTPFYAESGGQIGDTGLLEGKGSVFEVSDTRRFSGAFHAHMGRLRHGVLQPGDRLSGHINSTRRADTVRHHSATHLLHAALRKVLGEHVQQKGSLVAPDRLRFDFSHPAPVSEAEQLQIERLVNAWIQANTEAEVREMPFDEAIEAGALAFFDEKYADEVRVLRFGDYSMELCGGTHVNRAGDIGLFKIVSESGVSAGVRRIEAVAGRPAIDWVQQLDRSLRAVSRQLKTSSSKLPERIEQLQARSRELEKELDQLRGKLASAAGSDLASRAVDVAGIKLIAARLDDADSDRLRDTVDQLKNKIGSGVIVLASTAGGAVRLVAGVTQDLTNEIRAGDLIKHVAARVGGKGGGRPDFAQAGGSDANAVPAALEAAAEWLRERQSR